VEEEGRNKHHLAGQDQRRKVFGKVVECQILVGMEVSAACEEVEYELVLGSASLTREDGVLELTVWIKLRNISILKHTSCFIVPRGFRLDFNLPYSLNIDIMATPVVKIRRIVIWEGQGSFYTKSYLRNGGRLTHM
jgi:hypothetical protein